MERTYSELLATMESLSKDGKRSIFISNPSLLETNVGNYAFSHGVQINIVNHIFEPGKLHRLGFSRFRTYEHYFHCLAVQYRSNRSGLMCKLCGKEARRNLHFEVTPTPNHGLSLWHTGIDELWISCMLGYILFNKKKQNNCVYK